MKKEVERITKKEVINYIHKNPNLLSEYSECQLKFDIARGGTCQKTLIKLSRTKSRYVRKLLAANEHFDMEILFSWFKKTKCLELLAYGADNKNLTKEMALFLSKDLRFTTYYSSKDNMLIMLKTLSLLKNKVTPNNIKNLISTGFMIDTIFRSNSKRR